MSVKVQTIKVRNLSDQLSIHIVGAGLGGLGAAIALLLAGHRVTVLEAANEISEVGAGIQILPNSSRVLQSWGLRDRLEPFATKPSRVNMHGWKGNLISSLDTAESAAQYPGTFYWDFHRANLHRVLLERAIELGAELVTRARVVDVRIDSHEAETATIVLQSGQEIISDLVVGADGINSTLREILVGHPDQPTPTGDLAYRLLLSTSEMLKDPELAQFVHQPQVNYWMGPDAHAVNYVLRGGELFNMVLLTPDDIPADGPNTLAGNVDEMRAVFKDWDPRIPKLLNMCESVYKWKLQVRVGMESWSHPSGALTMLGDAVHATLPYLASGAGMCLEDAAVLGEIFSRVPSSSSSTTPTGRPTPRQKRRMLAIYEACRRDRTEMIVRRGNLQQYLYHLADGPEQRERDRKLVAREEGEVLAWRDSALAPKLLGYRVEDDVDKNWPASGIDDDGPSEQQQQPAVAAGGGASPSLPRL